MTRIVLNRTAAARRPRMLTTARAHSTPREAADLLDRSTAWPVHRIRWFLSSQSGPEQRRSPAV